jgi:ribosomal-protein-alanine N-acetyltransferase
MMNEMLAVRIRPASAADLDRVVAIERVSFSDPPWSRASFASLIDDPHAQFLVATVGSAEATAGSRRLHSTGSVVAGYVVTWVAADEGDLSNLAVAPDLRRNGVGGQLLDAAIESARAAGVRALYLEVRESNAVALHLYASRGFGAVGRRQRYYRQPVEDALILCLDPSSHRPAA